MRTFVLFGVVLGPLLAGCGGETVCQRADRTNRELADKASRGGCDVPPVYNVDSCEERSVPCSDRDRQLLETSFECFRPLQCEPFRQDDFEAGFRECRAPLRELSADCPLVIPFL